MARAVEITGAKKKGDDMWFTGTVDGEPVTIHVWQSHLQGLPTNAARKLYVAQQMAQALDQMKDQGQDDSSFNGPIQLP